MDEVKRECRIVNSEKAKKNIKLKRRLKMHELINWLLITIGRWDIRGYSSLWPMESSVIPIPANW